MDLELYLGLPVLELDRFRLCRGQFESALNLRGPGDVTRLPRVLLPHASGETNP
jgi:hypothetical protein